jgi:ankyrin repeat protein
MRKYNYKTTLILAWVLFYILAPCQILARDIPLHVAVKGADIAEVKRLIASGANVNEQDYKGTTALSLAFLSSQQKITDYLLEHGADPNADKKLIRDLIRKGDIKTIERLLNNGANINGPLNTIWSDEIPLLEAIQYKKLDIALMLIKRGANVNIEPKRKDRDFENPLSLAAYDQNMTFVLKALLEAGADPNIQVILDSTPLQNASKINNIDAVRLLIGKGANVNAADSDGITPLIASLSDKKRNKTKELETVKTLIANGADVNSVYQSLQYSESHVYNGNSLLHYAIISGTPETIKYLLSLKLNINLQNKRGVTPLHYAANQRRTDNFELLLKNGANPRIKDNDGKDPIFVALDTWGKVDGSISDSYKKLFRKYKLIE